MLCCCFNLPVVVRPNQTTCKAYDPTTPFDDLKLGCTGDINAGDIIIRSWALKDPPAGSPRPLRQTEAHRPGASIVLFFLFSALFSERVSRHYSVGIFLRPSFPCYLVSFTFCTIYPILPLLSFLAHVFLTALSFLLSVLPLSRTDMTNAQVKEILAAKKYRKDSGTNAEDEAKAPSVEVPADFEDF